MHQDIHPNMPLSDHFTLAEAVHSETAQRLRIDNKPDALVILNLCRTAKNILEPVREFFGIPFSPTSWFRCSDLNHAIGGSVSSDHVKGHAVDIKIPGLSPAILAQWVEENCQFDQLILEYHDPSQPLSGWVHVSYRSAVENRQEVLHTQKGKRFALGLGV